MKTYPLKPAQAFRLAGAARVVFLFLILPLTTVCFGAPQTNTIPWSDTFETFTNYAPLIDGTNGWYSSPPSVYDTNMPAQTSIVQNAVFHSGSLAAMAAIGDTLSNSFVSTNARIVKIEMYVQPQLWTSSVYPSISSPNVVNPAAQFLINSNGYFVVGNGSNWNEITQKADGTSARPVTNTYFTRIQINLRYKNHTWNLKAWTNDSDLVASTCYMNFMSNLDTFSGFAIYNGTATSYVDDVSVTIGRQSKINGVSFDTIRNIDGTQPAVINGVSTSE